MEIEIAIEGPAHALSELSRLLVFMRPPMKNPEPCRGREGRAKIVLIEAEQELDETLRRISGAIRSVERLLSLPDRLEIRVRNLAYSEPPAAGQGYRTPFKPGSTVTIVPWGPDLCSWEGEKTIVIDSRNAFGTGRHPTSRLCLQVLEDMALGGAWGGRLRGKRVLDFGCGTGLLAIAAVKMGARVALGVEIDPRSARTAEKNAALNRVSDKVAIRQGSWASVRGRYDLILANVVPAVLLRTGRRIPSHLEDGGEAVVSGFGENRTGEVKAFFETLGLALEGVYRTEGWGAAAFVKTPKNLGPPKSTI